MFCSTAYADKDLWRSPFKDVMDPLRVLSPFEGVIRRGGLVIVESNNRTSRIYNGFCEAECSLAVDSSLRAKSISVIGCHWL